MVLSCYFERCVGAGEEGMGTTNIISYYMGGFLVRFHMYLLCLCISTTGEEEDEQEIRKCSRCNTSMFLKCKMLRINRVLCS